MAAQAPRHQIQMRSLNRSQRPILQAQTVAPALAWLAPSLLIPVTLMVLLILLRHRLNIGRLLAGVENRFRP